MIDLHVDVVWAVASGACVAAGFLAGWRVRRWDELRRWPRRRRVYAVKGGPFGG